jgi:hypothetical protein
LHDSPVVKDRTTDRGRTHRALSTEGAESRQQSTEGETYENEIFYGDDRRCYRHRRHLCDGTRIGAADPLGSYATARGRTSAAADTDPNAPTTADRRGSGTAVCRASAGADRHTYGTADGYPDAYPDGYPDADADGHADTTSAGHADATAAADNRTSAIADGTASGG